MPQGPQISTSASSAAVVDPFPRVMPVLFDVGDDVIALRMVGAYQPADIRAALGDALADPGAASPRGLLFDVRGSESLRGRPTEEVRKMGRYLASHGARYGGRLALVASENFAYGLMRLGAASAEAGGVSASVFRDEPSARAWLLATGGDSLGA